MYKSGTIHTGPGEPPNSISKPTPRSRQVPGKPITSGKLLKRGGPNGEPSKFASRPSASRPVPQQLPSSSKSRPVPQSVAAQSRPVPQPVAAAMNGIGHSRMDSSSSVRAPPPPPPPQPPPAAKKDTYRALYDFTGQTASELAISKDDLLEIIKKENNGRPRLSAFRRTIVILKCFSGWWLAKKLDTSEQGWTPSAYLKEEVVAPVAARPPPPPVPPSTNGAAPRPVTAAKAKPTPPMAPTKRPVGKKPAPAPSPGPRDSAVSGLNGDSGRGTPDSSRSATPSLAGGLAEALRARQASMQGKKDDDDDDW